jgi:hypothetical protein
MISLEPQTKEDSRTSSLSIRLVVVIWSRIEFTQKSTCKLSKQQSTKNLYSVMFKDGFGDTCYRRAFDTLNNGRGIGGDTSRSSRNVHHRAGISSQCGHSRGPL